MYYLILGWHEYLESVMLLPRFLVPYYIYAFELYYETSAMLALDHYASLCCC